jgi:acyl-coenzyme A thioesterase PaaI-like protein
MSSPLMRQWRRFSRLPGGRYLFGRFLSFVVPYAGSISPDVVTLEPGHARMRIADRRRVRNHLHSIHATALITLAETTANLAMTTGQPKQGRWIVTGMDSEFIKKARGTITAECKVEDQDWTAPHDVQGKVELRDSVGDLVMLARPRWRIGPV